MLFRAKLFIFVCGARGAKSRAQGVKKVLLFPPWLVIGSLSHWVIVWRVGFPVVLPKAQDYNILVWINILLLPPPLLKKSKVKSQKSKVKSQKVGELRGMKISYFYPPPLSEQGIMSNEQGLKTL